MQLQSATLRGGAEPWQGSTSEDVSLLRNVAAIYMRHIFSSTSIYSYVTTTWFFIMYSYFECQTQGWVMQAAQTIPCIVVTVNPKYHDDVCKICLPSLSNLNLKLFGKILTGPRLITKHPKNVIKIQNFMLDSV